MSALDPWDLMAAWLGDALVAMGLDDVLDVGAADACEDDELVDCADVTRVARGWVVRLSRVNLVDPVLLDEDEMPPDVWVVDELASDGALLTVDVDLAVDVVVGWFRDRLGVKSPVALGFSYSEA